MGLFSDGASGVEEGQTGTGPHTAHAKPPPKGGNQMYIGLGTLILIIILLIIFA
jgi:hypothetical protein